MNAPMAAGTVPQAAGVEAPRRERLARPMLKPGVRHAVVPNGVHIESGERSFLIGGQRLREAVRRMLVGLDGTRSHDALTGGMPAPLAPVLDTLLLKLDHFDMLTEGPSGAIDPAAFDPGLIRYVQQATPDWENCLAAWADATITISADAPIAEAIARSLRGAHAGSVHIAPPAGEEVHVAPPPAEGSPDPAAAGFDKGTGREICLSVASDAAQAASSALDDLANRHGVTIPCRLLDGNAVIGPDCREGLEPWRRATASLQLARSGSPPTTVAIATAMLAFEALACHVAGFVRNPAERAARAARVKVVRHDGTITTHGLQALMASAIERIAAAGDGHRIEPDDAPVASWFDAAFGPFAEIAVDGPAYPLAHESIGVRPADGSTMSDVAVDAWGISPATARERALALAVAAMVEQRTGRRATPGTSPIVAGRTVAMIENDAAALAIASMETFVPHHGARRIAIADVADADGQMLARLARLYAGDHPRVWARRSARLRVVVIWAQLGPWTVAVAGRELATTLTEALGDVVSAWQLQRLPYRQTCKPWSTWREAASADEPEALPPASVMPDPPNERDADDPRPAYELIDDPAIPPGFFAGYCRAERP